MNLEVQRKTLFKPTQNEQNNFGKLTLNKKMLGAQFDTPYVFSKKCLSWRNVKK